jgi:hypothetical protein
MNWYRFLCHLTHRIEEEAEFLHEEDEIGMDWNDFLGMYLFCLFFCFNHFLY